ncbi:MAG: DUF4239 domain-containing protein [Cyanobacteria bacterium HKST-UBA01]|nr:DUF4239 domain-containing protein [Cyanobacteria bacterium HKST-UBA01]
MELFLFGVLVSVVTIALAVGGLFFARKITHADTLKEHNQVADPMLQVIGTLYAVLLGLLVVQSMETFQKARLNVESEAVALADTFRLSTALPPKLRDSLQDSCLDYAKAVVEEEWDDMQREETCDRAWESIDKMWWDIISYEPTTVREQYVYPELLAAAKSLNDHRRSRLVTSRTWVSPILWVVLITGAISVITFTYSFGINSMKAQIFMTSLVALTLSLNIYLWSIYNNPFYGLLRVEPEAFKMDLEHFEFYRLNPDDMRWNKGMPDQKPGSVKKSVSSKEDLKKLEKPEKLDSDDREDREEREDQEDREVLEHKGHKGHKVGSGRDGREDPMDDGAEPREFENTGSSRALTDKDEK